MNVEIRHMDIDDVSAVYHLGEKLFTSKDYLNLYRTWDEYEVIELFLEDPEYCLVAEIESRVVGFALGTVSKKRRSAWKYGQLIWLGVTPEYQGTTIADRLFNNFQDLMIETGVRILLVDTQADNKRSITFFKNKGFGNPEKHLYMHLNLDARVKKFREKNMRSKKNRRHHGDE